MKGILAVLLSAFLCVQNVCAMPSETRIVYEDTIESNQSDANNSEENIQGNEEGLKENTQNMKGDSEENTQNAENDSEENAQNMEENSGVNAQDIEELGEAAQQKDAEETVLQETETETGSEIVSEIKTGETEEESGNGPAVSAPSVILMENSTGEVIYEKEADTARPPASVTKIMTMLLIFDAIESGKIHLEDEVTTSEYAASMGGSQVFLEPGETQTVETMLKCISVASANDACVAMAEYICGSEEEFVRQMNERAKGLGMENTNFVNCNGLDADGHVTSARDIALMSRELITKYPQIHDYCMIWMENITHTTNKGTSEFGLTNTNKLVRQYEYATGLKTGSTGEAKFCVSATAEKNGIELIAVVMAAEDSKTRFKDAVNLLNYGFGKCQLYCDEDLKTLENITVEGGVLDSVPCEYAESFRYLDTTGANLSEITKEYKLETSAAAPIKKGEKVGEVIYRLNDEEIGSVDIIAAESVKKAGIFDYLKKVFGQFRA